MSLFFKFGETTIFLSMRNDVAMDELILFRKQKK